MEHASCAVVVIGRNEGERLLRCLRSLPPGDSAIYVDSGSSDGSVTLARSLGFATIELDRSSGFTAARARNAGWRALASRSDPIDCVQFVDGDCEVVAGWLDAGMRALAADPSLGVVFGRRRERYPGRSLYNRLCDDEWNVPVGDALSCGGDAMIRLSALRDAGGYADDLIAGEEPDLCLRLRQAGWKVSRLPEEMTIHDANIVDLRAWLKRCRRAGFAYAEHLWRHRGAAIPQWQRQVASILIWAFALPATAGIAMLAILPDVGAALIVLLLTCFTFLAQICRIALRKLAGGYAADYALRYAGMLMLGKFAELTGMLSCVAGHVRRTRASLIEYKGAA